MKEQKKLGTLYLIPVPISDEGLNTLSGEVLEQTAKLSNYIVEDARTARRMLKILHPSLDIASIRFLEIDKHSGVDKNAVKEWITTGTDIGVMSEAGCPAVADPGNEIVAIAHQFQMTVKPLTGPNAIILALMASGLNGQYFSFNGYLPIKEPARSKKIQEMELLSAKENRTQIFIETPYRNSIIFNDLLKNLNSRTQLSVAYNLTAADEYIVTKTVAEWKINAPAFEKKPCVFLFLA
jgi:16S rRNA (cytidine1402-2'-O)-methyltransferase